MDKQSSDGATWTAAAVPQPLGTVSRSHASPSTSTSIPAELVIVDQIVALNIRHWRRAAGMTQEELGQKIGWSAANVSAAERSAAEGRERRRFDAQTLAELALALGVPLTALFLPLPGDEIDTRHVITGPEGREYSMAQYMELCVMPDSDEDTRAMNGYRDRFTTAMSRYLAPEWAAQASTWLSEARSPAARADLAGLLHDRELALLETAAELRELSRAIMEGAQ